MLTADNNSAVEGRFVTTKLPWLIGAGGLLVYLLTLNHWVSLLNLHVVARTSGWLWRSDTGRPLAAAIFFPFRILPEAWIPLALNLFTAIAAAATLMLLARSVALLRHDVAPDDPFRKNQPVSILSTPTAWMPPVFAALVCGLQLSFWEHATSASGEIINVLVFAFVVRCLLEFRLGRNQAWLSRAAFVFAAGMTNDWVLIAYSPVFLATFIWLKGFGAFWERRFLFRMTMWGLAGLSLYLLLPAVQSASAHGDVTFWSALKVHLRSQRNALMALRSPALHLLVLTALLPVLVLSIRWKSHTVQLADDNRFGVFFSKATGHFVHGLFFVTALWIALNPIFSPRGLELGAPMLIYYYLWALVAGYGAGYLLLFGSSADRGGWARLPVVVTWALLVLFPFVLLWKNLGQIRTTNGPAVREFARGLYEDLPADKSVVLSEDARQLLLLRAELAQHDHEKDPLLLETLSLLSPQYHTFTAGRFKSRWPVAVPTNQVAAMVPGQLIELVSAFATREPVVYLHPSSGLFFETFVDEPNGNVHHLVARPGKGSMTQTLTDRIADLNEQIWQRRWTEHLHTLAEQTEAKPLRSSRWSRPPLNRFQLARERNFTAVTLGVAVSKSLNYWGVELQRLGRWREAGVWFRRAIALNPDNLAAHINAAYNERCQQGDKSRLTVAWAKQAFPDLFGKYENWWEVTSQNGPVDEPTFLLRTGQLLQTSGNSRQAADAFARCAELSPDWPPPKLALAQCQNFLLNFAAASKLTDDLQTANKPASGAGLAQLLRCRVIALRGLGHTNDATQAIVTFVGEHGEHAEVLSTAANLYAEKGQFARELDLLNRLLEREPDSGELLARKGLAEFRLARHEDAIATLTAALALTPSNDEVRLLRAVVCLGAGRLDAARNDYQELLKKPGTSQGALFGLGGIAWREHDTNAVIEYYQQFLSNSISRSPQRAVAVERLKQLKDD